jgi:hypothetical protein
LPISSSLEPTEKHLLPKLAGSSHIDLDMLVVRALKINQLTGGRISEGGRYMEEHAPVPSDFFLI